MSNSTNVQERGRLTARVSITEQEQIEKAAQLSGSKVSQFLVKAALEVAERVIQEERTIRLTNEEMDKFLEILSSPPKPTQALINSIKQHLQGVKINENGNSAFELRTRSV